MLVLLESDYTCVKHTKQKKTVADVDIDDDDDDYYYYYYYYYHASAKA